MNNFQPNLDQILIKIDPPKQKKSESGLFIQSSDKDLPTGIVVAVGPTRNSIAPIVKVGDAVLLGQYSRQMITPEYALTTEIGILGILK